MKVKKMLSRLMDYFNADKHQQLVELKSIRKVLRKLKQKERELKSKFNEAKNAEQKEALQNKLDVIYAQRTKGMQVIRSLREQIKSGKSAAESVEPCLTETTQAPVTDVPPQDVVEPSQQEPSQESPREPEDGLASSR